MSAQKTTVGIIGCGNISSIYLRTCKAFAGLNLVACADIDFSRAQDKAAEYDIRAMSVDEMLADPSIELVINLTIPKAHAEVALAAVQAGKSVYNEKPLTITREDAQTLLKTAAAKGVRVGGAPDTFLGAGLQTCRRALDDGMIGRPVGATGFMLCPGHESWHPDPAFYYQTGGGPLFDMGPYYITALVSLLGPVKRVTGSARITYPERTITSKPKYGQTIQVQVPTHTAGTLEFANGAIATLLMSFDVWASRLPPIELYGSEGTMAVPDPNTFGGPIQAWRKGQWNDVPITLAYHENSRGLGVADMARGLRTGTPHRASGELMYHVLDIMHAIHDAANSGQHVELKSTCVQPTPLDYAGL